MRTRKSNRTRKLTVQSFDFGADSEAEDGTLRQEPSEDTEGEDETFNAPSASASEVESSDHEESQSEADVSDDGRSTGRHVTVPKRSTATVIDTKLRLANASAGRPGYLSIEPFVCDNHLPKNYAGFYDRYARKYAMVGIWYGPNPETVEKAREMTYWWLQWAFLPPKLKLSQSVPWERGMCSAEFLDREESYIEPWLERLDGDKSHGTILSVLSGQDASPYQLNPGTLPVLVGPYQNESEGTFKPHQSRTFSDTGIFQEEFADESDDRPAGWMLDAGGIVLNLDWARQGHDSPQLLALSVIPHGDQETYSFEEESSKPDFQKHGIIQIWECHGRTSKDGFLRPSPQAPKLQKTLCVDYGRVRRVKWSPSCRHLAVLCGDGTIYVIEPGEGADGTYLKVTQPLAAFSLSAEPDIKATAITWINFNRIAAGYSDGSIVLWSIRPHRLLSRHPAHHSPIIDIVSGYPSFPYLVASVPIGGSAKLLDLRNPSQETTEIPALSIHTAANLLAYSDHLLGFYALIPTANILNTTVGFMHHAHFPVARKAFTGESSLTAVAVGRRHPFLLVGTADGSLWAINPQVEIILRRREPSDRLRILQHEHRPGKHFAADSPAAKRGVSRIVQGFQVDKNRHAKIETTKGAPKARPLRPKRTEPDEEMDNDPIDVDDEEAAPADPSRVITYEPQSRITCIEWNPNKGYGCWAAVAMASGLVRIMDLGLEVEADE